MNKTDKMVAGFLVGLFVGGLGGGLLSLVLVPHVSQHWLPIIAGITIFTSVAVGGIIGAKKGKKMF